MNDQVAEIKSRTDIATIIGERIELKKAGRNYKANCPFHGEKTPSFMVSSELQIFKCFGCGESGDVFSFLEKYEGMEFPEALKYLADRAGIKLQRSSFGQASEKEKLIEINVETLKFYNYMLLSHPSGKRALEYLQKDRGLKIETIKEFQLGFSPENSYPISNFLIGKKKFSQKDIELAGIGIPHGPNVYDRFNGRVIFPLFDHRGNPIGFAGRILPWDKRETGKYINSPETPIYHKSSVLFGLNITRPLIKKKKVAIIVEGELDLISSYQAGIKNIVAIKGSAFTEDQVRLLSRFAPKFILALDSDMAGDAAARRGLTVASNSGIEVKVATITGYKDPDEAARGNIDSLKSDLINAKGVWDYIIESVTSKYDMITGEGKAKISKELTPILSEIEDKIVQAHYANIVAEKLGVPLEAVTEQLTKHLKNEDVNTTSVLNSAPIQMHSRKDLLEERFLTLSFQSNPKRLVTAGTEKIIDNPAYKKILEELRKYLDTKKEYSNADFGKYLPKELIDAYAKMVLNENLELAEKPDELKEELDLVQKELKILGIKENLKLLTLRMKEFEKQGDKDKLLKAQNEFSKLAKDLASIDTAESSGIIFSEE
ncbi:MAG: DNA primase [Ignavibacteria bacterium]|nr:DNA primase [Ignavibacteria bacterium]